MNYAQVYQTIAEKLLGREITVDDGVELSAIEAF
jgi:hypothetical protein